MNETTVQAIITFVVGGGAIALVTQIVRGVRLMRSGARASTREVIRDLAAARDEAEDRSVDSLADRDFWRNTAADYSFQLRNAGKVPIPQNPVPPSERKRIAVTRGKAAQKRRADLAPETGEIERVINGDH